MSLAMSFDATKASPPREGQVAPEVTRKVAFEDLPLQEGVTLDLAMDIFKIRELKHVSKDDQQSMIVKLSKASYAPGAHIITEGEDAGEPRLFFIMEGSVEIFIRTTAGKVAKIKELAAPFLAGEFRVFKGGAATATVRAKAACEVLALGQAECLRLKAGGNSAVHLIERDMLVRGLERDLTATSGGIFSGLKHDPLFMSSILTYSNRTNSAEHLHFIFAVEELLRAADEDAVREAFDHVWREHVDPDVSTEEARARALAIALAPDDRAALVAAREDLVGADGEVTPVDIDKLRQFYAEPAARSTTHVLTHVIPEFQRSPEYDDFLLQMFPVPEACRGTFDHTAHTDQKRIIDANTVVDAGDDDNNRAAVAQAASASS